MIVGTKTGSLIFRPFILFLDPVFPMSHVLDHLKNITEYGISLDLLHCNTTRFRGDLLNDFNDSFRAKAQYQFFTHS
jgi:hypothetical protein